MKNGKPEVRHYTDRTTDGRGQILTDPVFLFNTDGLERLHCDWERLRSQCPAKIQQSTREWCEELALAPIGNPPTCRAEFGAH